ncbi:uncharacterized protein LOC136072233 [Hydra vulgaris]|uniref:uncharacterized protein LOC136072233 n=1 Tax=Hydra vulgaris TaxID=6087 RepID=UPI0032EA5763
MYLDELNNFKPIRENNPRDVEKFADLLDVAVTNLKKANRTEELGDGTLYHQLQKKSSRDNQSTRNSYFGNSDQKKKINWIQKCSVCKNNHKIWECPTFQNQNIKGRWETAKKNKLCFRCLNSNHSSKECRNTRVCGIDGCTDTHNCLLHKKRHQNETISKDFKEKDTILENSHTSNIQFHSNHVMNYISLKTAPVILRNGNKKVVVNALLDNGSTKTCLNSDVADELSLQGKTEKVTVNMINGKIDSFETMPVEFQLESLNGETKIAVETFTVNNVTGNLKAVNWANLSKRSKRKNEPVARLTPLGWTCIGGTGGFQIHFTKITSSTKEIEYPNNTIKKLWDIKDDEEMQFGITTISPEDSTVLNKITNLLKTENRRYELKLPWKDNRQIENSYIMANLEDGWYLPYFPILRPDKSTTKVRIVFDGSAKYNNKIYE